MFNQSIDGSLMLLLYQVQDTHIAYLLIEIDMTSVRRVNNVNYSFIALNLAFVRYNSHYDGRIHAKLFPGGGYDTLSNSRAICELTIRILCRTTVSHHTPLTIYWSAAITIHAIREFARNKIVPKHLLKFFGKKTDCVWANFASSSHRSSCVMFWTDSSIYGWPSSRIHCTP